MPYHRHHHYRVRPFYFFPMRVSTMVEVGLAIGLWRALTTPIGPKKQVVTFRELLGPDEGIFSLDGRRVYLKGVPTSGLCEGADYEFHLRHYGLFRYEDKSGRMHQIESLHGDYAPALSNGRADGSPSRLWQGLSTLASAALFITGFLLVMAFALTVLGVIFSDRAEIGRANTAELHPVDPDAAFRGLPSGDFGKDWVQVDGRRIDNVYFLVPLRAGKVSIVHKGSSDVFPANDLPQGFLDEWKMTTSALRASDEAPNPYLR